MRFPGILEVVAEKLRGRYGSIRQRFWLMPIESIKLKIFYARGGCWIDFYRNKLDGYASINLLEPSSETYLHDGQVHVDYLVKHGLKPHHKLLDYGCGVLRTARYLVPYLNANNYVGLDISEKRIQKGRLMLSTGGISSDEYVVHVVRDCLLKELGDQQFDYVWANSVLTHMPELDIRILLHALKTHIHQNSLFYFTFSPSERIGRKNPKQLKIKDFYYPENYQNNLFEECGYSFIVMPDGHANKSGSPTVEANLRQSNFPQGFDR